MSKGNRKAIATLNELITTCKDGANGYHRAAADVHANTLKELFRSYADQRNEFVSELLPAVHRLDDEASRPGSVAGRVHRSWMGVKTTVTHQDAHAVLTECERGDRLAAKRYETALKDDWSPEIRALLEKQYAQVKQAHERVHNLSVIGALNVLIATCKDGENGYREAANDVTDRDLKTLLQMLVKQRGEFAAELTQEFHRMGGDREKTGTWSGKMHRGWMNLKAAVKSQDGIMILKECARGEQAAIKHYEQALAAEMPPESRALVEKQHGKVKEAHAYISALQAARVTV